MESAPSQKVPIKKEEKQQKETVTAPTKEIVVPAPSEEAPIKIEEKQPKETVAAPPKDTSASTNIQQSTLYHNAANGERSFIMLKPDAVHRGLVGEIVGRFEKRGFKLIALKFMQASQDLLKRHYADLSKKGFFSELIR